MNRKVRMILYSILFAISILFFSYTFLLIVKLAEGQFNNDINLFFNYSLLCITLFLCLTMIISILVKKKIFNKSIWIQGRILAIIYLLASIIFPRFNGYKTNFEILAWGDFVLIDGRLLGLGLVFASLCYVFYIGTMNQEEIECYL